MRFEKGHKRAKGGKRPGAGRPAKDDLRRVYITLNPLQKRLLYEITQEVRPQQAIQKFLNMNL
jgi:hypothetical protein